MSTSVSSRTVAITVTVGFMCWALMGWMLSMVNAGWFSNVFAAGESLLLPLSIMLGIMGILAFIDQRILDAVIFFGGAGLFWSDRGLIVAERMMATGINPAGTQPQHYTGWYGFIWAVYFFYLWLASMRDGGLRMLFLLGLWLTLLLLAIADWGLGQHALSLIGGYLGLITSILALLVSAQAILDQERGAPAGDT
jgi:uncharacterized protein